MPSVYPDDPLELAMRWLAGGEVKELPVLSRTNIRELKGTISLGDGPAAYARSGSVEEGQEASEPVSFPTAVLTERVGSPQTLVCTKDRRTFDRRMKQYHDEIAAMGTLMKMVPKLGVAAALCKRIQVAVKRAEKIVEPCRG